MRAGLAIAALILATPAWAATDTDEQERVCQLQADMIAAVQTARLDRVRRDDVQNVILDANPDWPDGSAQALPPMIDFIYGQKRRDLRDVDLAGATKASCIQNWEQLKTLSDGLSN